MTKGNVPLVERPGRRLENDSQARRPAWFRVVDRLPGGTGRM